MHRIVLGVKHVFPNAGDRRRDPCEAFWRPISMLKNPFSPRLLKTVQMSLDFARDREPVERQGGRTHQNGSP